jgi:homocysteine S-methyltransferase
LFTKENFTTFVEVVPPAGPDAGPLLAHLESIAHLPFQGFSVATNPLARPHMSAFAFSLLIRQRTGKPVILHCTSRDHNQLSLQGLLWGARASGLDTVLIATGDQVGLSGGVRTSAVHDLDVFSLIRLARQTGLRTGAVFDPRPESNRFQFEVHRLQQKVDEGAQFAVTQPVYDADSARRLAGATQHLGIPIFLGLLPLRSARHAQFLHQRVAGIEVPGPVQQRLAQAGNPVTEGTALACEMVELAQELFSGIFVMPPFGHFEILGDMLA